MDEENSVISQEDTDVLQKDETEERIDEGNYCNAS